jgi:DNA-binding CsgD family transcriptional regulator
MPPRLGPVLRGRRVECEALDQLLVAVRAGHSGVLVLRGDPGIGKSALLEYLVERAHGCRIARVAGIESDVELAFAGVHQLCTSLLDGLDRLPSPQADALRTVFGLAAGDPPDRFLVGLAVLGLVAGATEDEPLVCVIDDAQWLDRISVQTLAFVARRLFAESVVMVWAVREPCHDNVLAGLRELVVEGLGHDDARALLHSVVGGPVDEQVLSRIVDETRGNPLAVLELPHGLTPAELAAGFARAETMPVAGRIEEGFRRRLATLPSQTRRLVLTAAAEPIGDAALLWRALELLEVGADAAPAAAEAGLIELDAGGIRFRHPLVRSAAYRSASPAELQEVHRALAHVTDPQADPDRRAWHLALAAARPDEDVAVELERSANRACSRGGLAATAALLERAARLTPDAERRAERGLAAARATRDSGRLDVALRSLVAVEAGPPDPLRRAEVDWLRGQIAHDQRRGGDSAQLLLSAARRLDGLDPSRAREAHLEALVAALWEGGARDPDDVQRAAGAARAAPGAPDPPRVADLVLDAFAVRYTEGHTAGVPPMRRALEAVLAVDIRGTELAGWLWLAGSRVAGAIALELWDWDARYALAVRQVSRAREAGALVQLQSGLNFLAAAECVSGELMEADRLIEEGRTIAEATGNQFAGDVAMAIAAYRGHEAAASQLIASTTREATTRGQEPVRNQASYASAVLFNGLGRHDAARDAARQAFERDSLGYRNFSAPELAEAASRTGDTALVAAANEWLTERTRATPTDWALGIAARVRALLGGGDAERDHRESIERLRRTPLRVELARSRLLYGEWLRREGRRVDAREQLRSAHGMLTIMGVEAFAERARRELRVTGEKVPRRRPESSGDLTPQEAQIARLAAEGLSNPEIGTRLFLSPRTVEWHLKKVFTKLDISSRRQLRDALTPGHRDAVPA